MEKVSLRDAYGDTLVELGREDERIVVLDADLSGSTKTAKFAKVFPERFFNMGIAEINMMNVAAGLAVSGKIPFVSTFAIFGTGRAWEAVRQTICYPNLNVKIVCSHGGITVGEDGASHQALEDVAVMRSIPNMRVIVPADDIETKQVIRKVAYTEGPFYVRLSREKFPRIFDESYKFEIGKGHVLREGEDVTVISNGVMSSFALLAAEILEKEGISVEVIHMPTVKPIDVELVVKSASKTGAVVTAEEHSVVGGLGSAVAEVLVENYPVPMERLGTPDVFGLSGKGWDLLHYFKLDENGIIEKVKKVLARKK
ncbi:transketolase family protein [Phorcysia thermohydrogeniphila]|uniref:Transketolase n=1 Tax=Phorcysia thermohydrogeniphila TaxID=936138 RepID=A0A4R1G888_9BACT|nr:transketolase family protein [Phorcysia thermohydrogeniphila]TCK04004.1 transketolase [Phorcysia thermohydrogeniphila]